MKVICSYRYIYIYGPQFNPIHTTEAKALSCFASLYFFALEKISQRATRLATTSPPAKMQKTPAKLSSDKSLQNNDHIAYHIMVFNCCTISTYKYRLCEIFRLPVIRLAGILLRPPPHSQDF